MMKNIWKILDLLFEWVYNGFIICLGVSGYINGTNAFIQFLGVLLVGIHLTKIIKENKSTK